MDNQNILTALLGDKGATALVNSTKLVPEIKDILVPRVICSWIQLQKNWNGYLPGSEIELTLTKSDNTYSGSIKSSGDSFVFDNASDLRVTAALTIALGGLPEVSKSVRDLTLAKLGKNVDLLVKAEQKRVDNTLAKALIHDDPHNPMTVWRIEGPHGEGPYNTGLRIDNMAKWPNKPFGQPVYAGRDMGFDEDKRPGPSLDFNYDDKRAMYLPGARFAFEKPEHAHNWFGKEKVAEMATMGYHLRPIKAAKVYRSNTGKQVIYVPSQGNIFHKGETPVSEDTRYCLACNDLLDKNGHCKVEAHWPKLDKSQGEAKGKTQPQQQVPAKPMQAIQPLQPQRQPQQSKPRLPRTPQPTIPGMPKNNLTNKSEKSYNIKQSALKSSCGICGGQHFDQLVFTGCYCLKDLAKSVTTTKTKTGVNIKFDPSVDEDTIETVLLDFKGK